MPRKTRKQKLKIKKRQTTSPNSTELVKRQFTYNFSPLENSPIFTQMAKKDDLSPQLFHSQATVKNLLQSVLFALVIFSLDLVLYFAWFKASGI